MTAWDICQSDRVARDAGENITPRQEYYHTLRDALYQELTRDGRSELLDAWAADMQSGALTDMYLLDFAAMMACHGLIVRGQPLRDTSRHVPYARNAHGDKLRWAEMRPTNAYVIRVAPEVLASVEELRAASQTAPEPPDDAIAPPPESVAQRKFEQAQALNRRLEQQNAELIAERDALRSELRALQEGYISESLRTAAQARRVQMEEALARENAAQRAAATEAFRTQYAKELALLESRRFAVEREAQANLCAMAEEYRAVRADMRAQIDALQAQLAQQSAAWERQLYRAESRMLAQSYLSLSDLNATDMVRLLTDAEIHAAPAPVMTALKAMQEALHAQLVQLEQAMLRLGLQVIRPGKGEAFDGALHQVTGAVTGDVPGDGLPIRACVRPGVVLLKREGAEALVKAEVKL